MNIDERIAQLRKELTILEHEKSQNLSSPVIIRDLCPCGCSSGDRCFCIDPCFDCICKNGEYAK